MLCLRIDWLEEHIWFPLLDIFEEWYLRLREKGGWRKKLGIVLISLWFIV